MSNTVSKIDRLGLGPRVQELLKSGVTVGKKIAQILRDEEGIKISDSAVNRYLAGVRDTVKDDAYKIIRDHVDETIPQDLSALEEMELQCLQWSRENPKDAAERMSGAALAIDGELDWWQEMLADPDPKKRPLVINQIVKAAVRYVLKDARLQNKRIQAMAMATKIIDLKLRQAGLLDDEGKGRIIIPDRSGDWAGDQAGRMGDGYKPTVIKGGLTNSLGGGIDGRPGS